MSSVPLVCSGCGATLARVLRATHDGELPPVRPTW